MRHIQHGLTHAAQLLGLAVVNAVRRHVADARVPVLGFESWCTLVRDDDPETVDASGGATTVWVNFPQQKSVPLPAPIRALFA
jgi:hypothetical protein